jgi:rRNA processing protein Krr1/Pno1
MFHVNYDAVSIHIRQLLADDTIHILQQYNETAINQEIIHTILRASDPLPVKYLIPITDILLQLAGQDHSMRTVIYNYLRQKQRRQSWDSYKWVVMVVVTALICLLMYFVGQ